MEPKYHTLCQTAILVLAIIALSRATMVESSMEPVSAVPPAEAQASYSAAP